MASDERNFRSVYYEKVGFRNIEEKKSLENLLKEKPLDKQKLRKFCLRCTVPGLYRNLIWKILLGVLPIYEDSHEFIMSQREQEYKDLERGLKIMRIIDQHTPKSRVYFAMWSLENGQLTYDFNINQDHEIVAITQTLSKIFKSDTDIYWLAKGLYSFSLQFRNDIPKLIERTLTLLEKEDSELFNHLKKTGLIKVMPIEKWFQCCFAGYINEIYLVKIWDKLCGGSSKILVYVAFIYLTSIRRILIRCFDFNEIFQILTNVSEKSSENIVNQSIELWVQNGCLLTLQNDGNVKK